MKKLILAGAAVFLGTAAYAQSAIDGYRLSQDDLKGTARYMSMGGAFNALGGDLSTLSHNPAGIGVYRNSEVGFTLDLDLQNSDSNAEGWKESIDQTKFLLNNIGIVWTLKLGSNSCPNLNFGFTYNKSASFNRRYRGGINLKSSLSNYIGAITTDGGYVEGQLLGDEYNNYDPYNPTYSDYAAPWLSILGYDGYLISQNGVTSGGTPNYVGQWGNNTSGQGYYNVEEKGGVDSYNIALGGNISNLVFWGMDFDITHLNYTLNPQWTENLSNARVADDQGRFYNMNSLWTLDNYYNCSGTGFNYKFGIIVKPIQEIRIGFSFQTPTWYQLTETFDASLNYQYGNEKPGQVYTNDGYLGLNNVNFRTPWKLNAGAAAVLFNRLIVSADYEWTQYSGMRYSIPTYSGWGGDYWYPDDYYPWDSPWYSKQTRGSSYDPYISNDPYYYTNKAIKDYYCNTNTLSLGAEFWILPQLSLRAGYRHVSSPFKSGMNRAQVETAGTIPNYRIDHETNYATCGLGLRIQSFYLDLAYVYKHMNSTYHAFSEWLSPDNSIIKSPASSLSLNNSQIILSAGFKF